jgi:hypothetical protein
MTNNYPKALSRAPLATASALQNGTLIANFLFLPGAHRTQKRLIKSPG